MSLTVQVPQTAGNLLTARETINVSKTSLCSKLAN